MFMSSLVDFWMSSGGALGVAAVTAQSLGAENLHGLDGA